jgi:hypothetical protein
VRQKRRGGETNFLPEAKPEKQVLEEIKKGRNIPTKPPKKLEHPALGLTGEQLRRIHLAPRYKWPGWWDEDPGFKKWWLDEVWRRWTGYLDRVKGIAFTFLVIGIETGGYQKVVNALISYSEVSGSDIISPCMAAYSKMPRWALKAQSRAMRVLRELSAKND